MREEDAVVVAFDPLNASHLVVALGHRVRMLRGVGAVVGVDFLTQLRPAERASGLPFFACRKSNRIAARAGFHLEDGVGKKELGGSRILCRRIATVVVARQRALESLALEPRAGVEPSDRTG